MSNSSMTKTPGLPKQLDTQLSRHFLTCSAFVGTAVLMTASKADAAVVYSGSRNYVIPSTNNFGGLYLDLQQPGTGVFFPANSGGGPGTATGWDVNPYWVANGNRLFMFTPAPTASFGVIASGGFASVLGTGVTVDSSATFGGQYTSFANWDNVTDGYVGVRFLDSGSNERYGWIRFDTTGAAGFPATLVDWAYEDSGAGIQTGAGVIPEPSSLALGCLAAGAAGLAAWRRRKAA
jgi:hypothetical protein